MPPCAASPCSEYGSVPAYFAPGWIRPDIAICIEALEKVIGQKPIQGIDLRSPFLLRSVDPGIYKTKGNRVSVELESEWYGSWRTQSSWSSISW